MILDQLRALDALPHSDLIVSAVFGGLLGFLFISFLIAHIIDQRGEKA